MTIYNIPQMVALAFSRAMTIENISSGFRVTGIYPFDPNVHTQEDFAPSLVTDRPNPDMCEPGIDTTQTNENATTRGDSEAVPSISEVHAQMDEAEIVSGVEVTNGPVHETGQQTAVKSAEVRYSI